MASVVSPIDTASAAAHDRCRPDARALGRVLAYWRTFGVLDESHLRASAEALLERVQAGHPTAGSGALTRHALLEAARSIDEWLDALLAPGSAGPQARAVLLMRLRELLAHSPELFLSREAAARIGPEPMRILPEPLPTPMPTQSFSHPEPLPQQGLVERLGPAADGMTR